MIAVIVILAIVVLIVLYAVVAYNGLVRLRNRVENAWAQIDVQLKRRLDLIPNLVETVKGYAAHERDHARRGRPGPQPGIANVPGRPRPPSRQPVITGALRQLFALSEAYPDLKANQNFLSLQEELVRHRGPRRPTRGSSTTTPF